MTEETKDKIVEEYEREEMIEWFAARLHDVWAHWMKHQFTLDAVEIKDPTLVARWTRQMNTAYEGLSEEEKQSDRDVFHKCIRPHMQDRVIDPCLAMTDEEKRRESFRFYVSAAVETFRSFGAQPAIQHNEKDIGDRVIDMAKKLAAAEEEHAVLPQ